MNAVSCRHYLCYKGLLENILNIFVAFVCHNHPTIGLVLITVVCSVVPLEIPAEIGCSTCISWWCVSVSHSHRVPAALPLPARFMLSRRSVDSVRAIRRCSDVSIVSHGACVHEFCLEACVHACSCSVGLVISKNYH